MIVGYQKTTYISDTNNTLCRKKSQFLCSEKILFGFSEHFPTENRMFNFIYAFLDF